MAYNDPAALVPSAARTTSGATGPLALDPGANVHAVLDVTAVSGATPTLDVHLEWSLDGGTTWAAPGDSFAQVSASGTALKTFPTKAPVARVVWTIGGASPSFTFSLRAFVTN